MEENNWGIICCGMITEFTPRDEETTSFRAIMNFMYKI
jgi:hypothetical protein